MSIYKNNKKVIALYKGATPIKSIMKGTTSIYKMVEEPEIEATPYTLAIDWTKNKGNGTTGNTFYTIDTEGNYNFITATTNPFVIELTENVKNISFNNLGVNEYIHFPSGVTLNTYGGIIYHYLKPNLKLNNVNLGDVELMNEYIFSFTKNLETIELLNWRWDNTREITTVTGNIFATVGKTIKINGWYMPKLTALKGLITFHTAVERLYMADIDMSNITDFSDTFRGCEKLMGIDVSGWNVNVNNVTNTQFMFRSCVSLRVMNLGNVTQEQYNWWYARLVDEGIQDNVTLNCTIV